MTAVVRVAGLALQISPTRFQSALGRSNALNAAVQTLNRALMAQFQHVAACNALHSVEARLPRWLLHVHDRADGDVLPLTQETLAEFLGVRRTTVTQVISKLRESGAIRSNARSSIEIDRPRLEAAACECYQLMRRRIDRIVLPAKMTPPGIPGLGAIPPARSPCSPRRTEFIGARDGMARPGRGQGAIDGMAAKVAGRLYAGCRASAARGPCRFSLGS